MVGRETILICNGIDRHALHESWKHHKTAHASCACTKQTHVLPPKPHIFADFFVDAYVNKLSDLQLQAIFLVL
jgi:hypothetical protein